MGSVPTRAYFWSAVNKRPTRLQPKYFPTQPEEIFFDTKGKKLKILTFLGEIFQIQTQTINGRPDPSHKKLTRVKNFWPGPITIQNTSREFISQIFIHAVPQSVVVVGTFDVNFASTSI